jgi:hypothetical protein
MICMISIFKNYNCVCGKCRLNSSDSKFVAPGKKTEFILVNNSNKIVDKYIVDECLLKSKLREEKCDYLFNINEDRISYFIECKGSDILKAVDQLNSSLNILWNDLLEYTLKAKIVPTKVHSPDMRTNKYKKLRKRLNGNLVTKNIVCTETI